jgi:hypothetical protein
MPSQDATGGRLGWEMRNAAFNNRMGKGPLDYGGNMITWGATPALAGAGSTVNNTAHVGPTTININGAGDAAKVAREVIREQERRAQMARQLTRDAQAGHR